jgi:hypothetical protein
MSFRGRTTITFKEQVAKTLRLGNLFGVPWWQRPYVIEMSSWLNKVLANAIYA